MISMHAFILAGGFATRLWPLTEKRAKPLLPLAGKPLLTHIVERIPESLPVTVSTNAAFGEGIGLWRETMKRANISVVVEQTKSEEEKLGTLGATTQWVEKEGIEEDILLLTGDNYFGFSFETFLKAYDGVPLLAAYDIGSLERAKSFGTVVLGKDGTIASFEEKPASPRSTLISTGCSVLPSSLLPVLKEYAKRKPDNVGGIFEECVHRGIPVRCFRFSEAWFDIGSFEAYIEATKALVGGNVLAPSSASLKETTCEGSVVIGEKTRVSHSTLRDTVIFGDCSIEDCILDRCVIDDGCTLKGVDLTGKMLRAGTVLMK